ncbi:unnamed protein product [Cyprideis torosa]|uniref:Uncharacterized protein n=1 Tax=Cyprideis torosa TaxID=163714 RepID=A0A7R8WVI6_9CRUS|nr:unnamed protein product [Cyprideis torosa]CAG0910933.1 unnamed protein product [Cyprideis torosa]
MPNTVRCALVVLREQCLQEEHINDCFWYARAGGYVLVEWGAIVPPTTSRSKSELWSVMETKPRILQLETQADDTLKPLM